MSRRAPVDAIDAAIVLATKDREVRCEALAKDPTSAEALAAVVANAAEVARLQHERDAIIRAFFYGPRS